MFYGPKNEDDGTSQKYKICDFTEPKKEKLIYICEISVKLNTIYLMYQENQSTVDIFSDWSKPFTKF